MTIDVDIDNAAPSAKVPDQKSIVRWVMLALQDHASGEVSIRIVDENESALLNTHYRDKQGPTNVLSFPADIPEVVQSPLLGDLVICAAIVEKEAAEQHKPLDAHWAHIVIHGVLHLLGYDHLLDEEAAVMEQREINLLKQLGYDNPYLQEDE